jgi:predicted small metal-binding protein
MFRDKALRCDCGYEVRARDEEAAVEEIRQHASEAHGIEFTVELALDVVRKARLGSEHDGAAGKEKQ